jgi:amphi-Trp domain-containing protein
MSDFKHKEQERLSRQHAAERLIDIAYALSAGPPFELRVDGEQIRVPVPDELHLERQLKSRGEHVELELELTWSRPPE